MSGLFSLQGEVVVVIGGTGGLGGAMADALAAQGAKVAVVGRSPDRGAQRVAAIEKLGGQAIFQAADALQADSLNAACQSIQAQLGPVTVLVNALAATNPKPPCHLAATSASCRWVPGKMCLTSISWVVFCCPAKSSGPAWSSAAEAVSSTSRR